MMHLLDQCWLYKGHLTCHYNTAKWIQSDVSELGITRYLQEAYKQLRKKEKQSTLASTKAVKRSATAQIEVTRVHNIMMILYRR